MRPSSIDLLGQRDGRHAAVVERDHVGHAGLLDGGDHLLGLGHVHGQRLLADDHLAGLGGGQHDLVVHVVGRADVDQVDVLALDQLPPVGLDRLVAPGLGERLELLFAARGHRGLEHRLGVRAGRMVDLAIGVRVGAAHEPQPIMPTLSGLAIASSTFRVVGCVTRVEWQRAGSRRVGESARRRAGHDYP